MRPVEPSDEARSSQLDACGTEEDRFDLEEMFHERREDETAGSIYMDGSMYDGFGMEKCE